MSRLPEMTGSAGSVMQQALWVLRKKMTGSDLPVILLAGQNPFQHKPTTAATAAPDRRGYKLGKFVG